MLMSYEFELGLPAQSFRKGVGMLIVNKDYQIFMAQRKRAHHGVMQMPQGGIDQIESQDGISRWESPIQAMRRELYEETGLCTNVQVLNVTGWLTYTFPEQAAKKSYHGQFIGQQQRWFLIAFYGNNGDIKLGNEFCNWNWMHRADVVNATVPFKQGLYRKVLTLLMNNLDKNRSLRQQIHAHPYTI